MPKCEVIFILDRGGCKPPGLAVSCTWIVEVSRQKAYVQSDGVAFQCRTAHLPIGHSHRRFLREPCPVALTPRQIVEESPSPVSMILTMTSRAAPSNSTVAEIACHALIWLRPLASGLERTSPRWRSHLGWPERSGQECPLPRRPSWPCVGEGYGPPGIDIRNGLANPVIPIPRFGPLPALPDVRPIPDALPMGLATGAASRWSVETSRSIANTPAQRARMARHQNCHPSSDCAVNHRRT